MRLRNAGHILGRMATATGPDARIPRWIKWSYTVMMLTVVVSYWVKLGAANFLWFSDIALIVMALALWLESRFLVSTMAVGVLALELGWLLDFVTGGTLWGLAAYMFDPGEPIYTRTLSAIFHIALPLAIIYGVWRLGYDRRALPAQTILLLLVIPLSRLLTGPEANINWVYGPGEVQESLPPAVYLALLMLVFIVVVYIPSHLVLKRIFPVKDEDPCPEP